jgi:hypothetical protein
MTMKKLLALVLALSMAAVLAGCGTATIKDALKNIAQIYESDFDDAACHKGSGESSDAFTRLNVDWVSGHITVKPGESDVVTISEPDGFDEDHQLRWIIKDDCLSVYFCKSHLSADSIFDKKDLVITLPKSIPLEEVDIDSVSAGAEISSLHQLNSFELDTVSGNARLTDISARELSLDTVSGQLSGSVSTRDLRMDSVSGAVDLTLASVPDEIKGDSVSGSISVAMPACDAVQLRLDSTSGAINSDFASDPSADRLFDIETVSGGITLICQ